MDKKKIALDIEEKIWEAIKDVSDPNFYDWEVTFKVKGEKITLSSYVDT